VDADAVAHFKDKTVGLDLGAGEFGNNRIHGKCSVKKRKEF
jgi:hypothetical protein